MNYNYGDWIKGCPAAVTICDENKIIVEMNDAAAEMFQKDGGRDLISSNIQDCHPQKAQEIISKMYEDHQPYIYSITKNGRKKMVYQTPWFRDGKFGGILEILFETPSEVPHFDRD
ncbi:diguanylate cyclase [bacterium]|nr:diguanylate cyclase [bacterium]